ncbi:MAG: DUF4390 domain-containing protein [Arenicellales bacterium]|jgi:hypothetical protein
MARITGISIVLWLLLCGTAEAQFVVDHVEARQVGHSVRVKVNLDLSLTDAADQALSHGVPLIVVNEIELLRRGWLWDHVAQRISERHRLRYYALSGQYVLDSGADSLNAFRTVSDALKTISSATASFELPGKPPDKAQRDPPGRSGGYDGEYVVAVRSRIDINALPAPLRPTALFSPQWQISSDWTQWPISESSTN